MNPKEKQPKSKQKEITEKPKDSSKEHSKDNKKGKKDPSPHTPKLLHSNILEEKEGKFAIFFISPLKLHKITIKLDEKSHLSGTPITKFDTPA